MSNVVYVSEASGRVVTAETIVKRIFKDMRALRINDGPSGIHRWNVAKKSLSEQH